MNEFTAALGGTPGVLGWITAIVAPFLVYRATNRKTDVDESTLVLNQWKLLFEAHKKQQEEAAASHKAQMDSAIVEYERRMGVATEEIASLRVTVAAQEKKMIAHENRITSLEEENRRLSIENDGYRRQLAQRSQSEMAVLPPNVGRRAPTARARFTDPDSDMIEKLDQAGHNSEGKNG